MSNQHALYDFINSFNGGFRTNRFVVNCPFLGGNVPFHIRAASMPAVTTTVIQVPHRGRIFKMPGQRTFGSWIITILDDIAGGNGNTTKLWDEFHAWSNDIQDNIQNTVATGTETNWNDQMTNFDVYQLEFNGTNAKVMTLNRAWPAEVGEIRFSQDDQETLCTFNVTLEYQYISYWNDFN